MVALGRLGGPHRQVAHFVGHTAKPPPLAARAGLHASRLSARLLVWKAIFVSMFFLMIFSRSRRWPSEMSPFGLSVSSVHWSRFGSASTNALGLLHEPVCRGGVVGCSDGVNSTTSPRAARRSPRWRAACSEAASAGLGLARKLPEAEATWSAASLSA